MYDKKLSRQIDRHIDELERLAWHDGVWAALRRWWVRRQLRRLERRIPQ